MVNQSIKADINIMPSNNNEVIIPAFTQVKPEQVWLPVELNNQAHLTAWSTLQGEWQCLDTAHTFPYGYYRCKTTKQDYFLKILQKKHAQSSIQADDISQFLASKNISVNCLNKKIYAEITYQKTSCILLCYPYIEGRFFNHSEQDCYLLGSSLATIHNALSTYPHASHIKAAAKKREKDLYEHWQYLRSTPEELNKLPLAAQSILLANNTDIFTPLQRNAQVIHGDLNAGNLLFQQSSLHIIDWEDCLISWSSPIQDIAFVIERFILLNFFKPSKKIKSFNKYLFNFLTNYVKQSCNPKTLIQLTQQKNIITNTIKALSIKSLLILARQSYQHNEIIHLTEWSKFIELYEFTSEHTLIIEQSMTTWAKLYFSNEHKT